MLQAILGSHPDIHTCSEPWIALPFVYAASKKNGCEFEFNGAWAKNGINAFLKEGGIDDSFFNSALSSFLRSIYHKALERSGKSFFLDKTPRYYEIVFELIDIFPDAKFIILYRHPLAVLHSILNTWVKINTETLFYHSRDLLVAPKKLADFAATHADAICLMRYEDIVKSPHAEIKRACEYIGVEFFENIINYNSKNEWYYGDKNFKNKNMPDSNSIESWKFQVKNRRDVNFIYYYLKELGEDLFNSLGYNFTSTLDSLKALQPDQKDFNTWQAITQSNYISSIDEQLFNVNTHLDRGYFSKFISKFTNLSAK